MAKRGARCAAPLDVRVPRPVLDLIAALAARGHDAVLVGGCVRDLWRGLPVADFDVATSASPEAVLALFPRAIPIGLRHGTVMVPTVAGPVDVTTYRAGPRLEDDLAARDFTVNAMAFDPRARELVDPFGGAGDLAAGRLRAVGSADARLAEDPLRALRAARLVAALGLRPDPDLEPALARARSALLGVARERVRQELQALLLAEDAPAGLALLRRTGIEEDWVPGAAPDAADVVGALPRDLTLRLCGWLRGTKAAAALGRLRFGQRRVREIATILALHPLDARPLSREVDVRRLLRRAPPHAVDAALALREAEIAAAAARDPARAAADRERLTAVRERIDRVRSGEAVALHRSDLVLAGREVMEILGTGPGPRVGAALSFLTERVLEDPSCNTRERLAGLLEAWRTAEAD
jgi:tRNA nucleotidyltransferase (CCA-adding enzyme)